MLRFNAFTIAFLIASAIFNAPSVNSFAIQNSALTKPKNAFRQIASSSTSIATTNISDRKSFLQAQGDDEGNAAVLSLSKSDQVTVGVVGTKMSLIMLCSEYVLKTTGCGLPAGPYGLIGAAEGISYLGVTALAAFSIFTKVKTGSGLPAGPKGILGLAEGLSFLAIAVGVAVLLFQVFDYGYIPNAVPVEGGICQ
jgi:hypothetical protein